MKNKRIILLIGLLLLAAGLIGFFLIEKTTVLQEVKNANPTQHKSVTDKKSDSDLEKATKINKIQTKLYSENPNYMPFVSAVELSKIEPATKAKLYEILEQSQGFYLLKQNPDTQDVFVILQNPVKNDEKRYARHNLQTVKIGADGNVSYINIGFDGLDNETENAVVQCKNEEWIFDESIEPFRPLKHIMYDKKKKVLYTEVWNYDDAEPIKYELIDGNGKILSVKKETQSGDMEYREEHVFYNEEGNTVKSISITYEGPDIRRFTCYNTEIPDENITIESIYDNGLKTAEKVYDQGYKLITTINADYKNGEITALEVIDLEDSEAETDND